MDTTVHPKNVPHPPDAKLLLTGDREARCANERIEKPAKSGNPKPQEKPNSLPVSPAKSMILPSPINPN